MSVHVRDEDFITPEIIAANHRHDLERHQVSMDPKARIRSRSLTNVVGKLLSDKKIAQYEAQGYYSEAFREARRKFWSIRNSKLPRREGNFLVHSDGRKVFSPT